MAVAIRLARGGAKKRPYYKIVVADARNARDGKFIERIGSYNPLLAKDDPERIKLDADRARHCGYGCTGEPVNGGIQRESDNVTWQITPEYRINDDLMTYLVFAHGRFWLCAERDAGTPTALVPEFRIANDTDMGCPVVVWAPPSRSGVT